MRLARNFLSKLPATRVPALRWWYVFALWMALPTAILGLFAMRTVRLLRVEEQQRVAEQRRHASRVADAMVSVALDEVEGHAEAFTFTTESGNLIVFARDRLYFGAYGTRPAAAQLQIFSRAREMAEQLQAEASPQARESIYRTIGRMENALAEWSAWSLSKTSGRDWGASGGMTPSGLPLALIAAESSGQAWAVRPALEKMRAGQWWLSYDERAFHDAELTRLLRTVGIQVGRDERLAELALAEQLLQLALPRLQSGNRRVFVARGQMGVLFLARSEMANAGTAISMGTLKRLLDPALRDIAPSAAALRISDGGLLLWTAAGPQHPIVDSVPITAVPGWELAFAEWNAAASVRRQQWLWYGFVGLLLMMLGSGVVMTGAVVRREMDLARRQSDFVAAVTHELKSPITSIRLLLERLSSQRVAGPEAIARYYSAIESETARLDRLVNRVLDSQKILAGKMIYDVGHCSLSAIVQTSAARFQGQAAARQVTLRLEIEDSVSVAGDEIALAEAIDNLIDNAIRYSGPSSVTIISTRQEGESAIVEVRDQGIGIDADDLPHLFDPFFRGRRGNRYNVRGTGLGLALVKAAVEAHGGVVEVANAPSGGSVFRMKLLIRGIPGKEE